MAFSQQLLSDEEIGQRDGHDGNCHIGDEDADAG
jgi:hypothetical protein